MEKPTDTSATQEMLLAVTNAMEGVTFTPTNATNTAEYVNQLFPLLTSIQAEQAAGIYSAPSASLSTVWDQAVAVWGEGKFL